MRKIFIFLTAILIPFCNPLFGDDIHHTAAYGSGDDMTAFLNENGGLINEQDEYGNTPVMTAALHNNFETFRILIENGCDIVVENKKGGILLFYIAGFEQADRIKALELLHNKGVNLDSSNSSGMTLLHYAVYGGNTELLKEILQYPVDVNKKEGITGLKPIDIALILYYQYTDLIKYDDNSYKTAKKIEKMLLASGSEKQEDLPIQINIFGDFIFSAYVAVSSLFPFDLSLNDVNRQQYFYFGKRHNREYALITGKGLEMMFNDFGFRVEIKVHNSRIPEVLNECEKSEDRYVVLANTGNHPLIFHHWVLYSGHHTDGIYKNYLENYYDPSGLTIPLFFRVEDIKQIITIRIIKHDYLKK